MSGVCRACRGLRPFSTSANSRKSKKQSGGGSRPLTLDIAARLSEILSRPAPTPDASSSSPATTMRPISQRRHVIVPRSERNWPIWTRDKGVARDWAVAFPAKDVHPNPRTSSVETNSSRVPAKNKDEWRWDLEWAATRPLPRPVGERKIGSRALLKKLKSQLRPQQPNVGIVEGPFAEATAYIESLEDLEHIQVDDVLDSLADFAEMLRDPSAAMGAMVANLLRRLTRASWTEKADEILDAYLADCKEGIFEASMKPSAVMIQHYLVLGEAASAADVYVRMAPSASLASALFPRLATLDPELAFAVFKRSLRNMTEPPPLPVCNALLKAALISESSSALELFRVLRKYHEPNAETTAILLANASDTEEVRAVLLDSLKHHPKNEMVLTAAVDAIDRLEPGRLPLVAFENWAANTLPFQLPPAVKARLVSHISRAGHFVRVPMASRTPGIVGTLLRAAKHAEDVRKLYAELSQSEIPEPVLVKIIEALGRTGDTEGVRELYQAHSKTNTLSETLLNTFIAAMKSQPELAEGLLRRSGASADAAVEILDGIGDREWHVLPRILATMVERGVEGVPREKVARALRRAVSRAAKHAGPEDQEMELLRDAVTRAAARGLEEAGAAVRAGEDVDEALDRLEAFFEAGGLDEFEDGR